MMRLLLPLLLCVGPLAFAQEGGGAAVTFGSKNFTESVVLGEVGAGLFPDASFTAALLGICDNLVKE